MNENKEKMQAIRQHKLAQLDRRLEREREEGLKLINLELKLHREVLELYNQDALKVLHRLLQERLFGDD